MTPREAMIHALCCEAPVGRVPHFELEFFLTMEAFGRIHPSQRHYHQWRQMTAAERELHRRDVAELHLATARRFGHAGILFHAPTGWTADDLRRSLAHLREISNHDYLILLHGDATYSIPHGDEMMDFVGRLVDEPAAVKAEAQVMVRTAEKRAEAILEWNLIDGFCLCADYCFNDNPFLSPAMFGEFVTPYLHQLVKAYRDLGYYVIKHTDGNIMPIVEDLLGARPHALHSLDPQGGVDLVRMKQLAQGEVCLIGNVHCGLLQSGSDEAVEKEVRRALREGMPGGGYIFGTSNCIYTGLPLARYERMLEIWKEEGNYP